MNYSEFTWYLFVFVIYALIAVCGYTFYSLFNPKKDEKLQLQRYQRPLYVYIEKTRPDLYAELSYCGTNMDRARVLSRDSGIQILGTDGLYATEKKLLEHYMRIDAGNVGG